MVELTKSPETEKNLSLETFLDDCREELQGYHPTLEQCADFAAVGREFFASPGYLDRLYMADTERVKPTDQLCDVYIFGVALGVPELSEKAQLLLAEHFDTEESLRGRLWKETRLFLGREKEGRGKKHNKRYDLLKQAEVENMNELLSLRRAAKAARKAGKTAIEA